MNIITLSQAFIWRSRFQKYLNSTFDTLKITPDKVSLFKDKYFLEPLDDKVINEAVSNIKTNKRFFIDGEHTVDELWKNYNLVREALEALQDAIDNTNVNCQALSKIHKIQNLQKQLRIAQTFSIYDNEPVVEIKRDYTEKEYNPETKSFGRNVYTYLYPMTTSDWNSISKSMELEIRNLTDELTAINGCAKINLPEDKKELIEKAQKIIF